MPMIADLLASSTGGEEKFVRYVLDRMNFHADNDFPISGRTGDKSFGFWCACIDECHLQALNFQTM